MLLRIDRLEIIHLRTGTFEIPSFSFRTGMSNRRVHSNGSRARKQNRSEDYSL
jgi:hypothetical protein